MKMEVPPEAAEIAQALLAAGFEAYLVGGCVRDMLLGREPKDWDIVTNAKPDEIQKIFPDSVYENEFGTVGVKTRSEEERLKVVEVTTYRIEGKYSDKRHPDEVKFAKTIEEDLSRRDFTVNAMALGASGAVIDPFVGAGDIESKMIRTVGEPEARFSEDALRLIRAVRFAVDLDFQIDMNTRRAIEKLSRELGMIAKERIRDEFVKIIMTRNAARGILLLEELGLLEYVLPELREGIGVEQNLHHIYSVFEHNVRALDYVAKENYSLVVRLASLLHDVGKPRTKAGSGRNATFYRHEYVGAKMAAKALDRLRFPKDIVEAVAHLVRQHMFYYNVGDVSPRGVRRFLARVGPETVPDLLKVREADRIGSGVPKAVPYKTRHLMFMIDAVKNDPISAKMLRINGDDIMQLLGIAPGPRVGWILAALLEEVLDDPAKNVKEQLASRARELALMSDDALKKVAAGAKERKEEAEQEAEEEIKKKYRVS